MPAVPAPRAPAVLLALLVGLAWTWSFVTLGGVLPAERVVSHGLIGLALVVAIAQPAATLARTGWMRVPTTGFLLLVGAVALGLIQLPGTLAGPCLIDVPAPAWRVVSCAPTETAAGLADLFALGGFGAAVAVAVAPSLGPRRLTNALLVAATLIASTDLGHRLVGAEHVFGVWPARQVNIRTILPIQNPGHAAALLNLLLPACLHVALRPGEIVRRSVAGFTSLLTILVVAWSQSSAAALVMCSILGWALWDAASSRLRRGAGHPVPATEVAPLAALGLLWLAGLLFTVRHVDHVVSRWTFWQATASAWADHIALGTGRGALPAVIGAYRTDHQFVVVSYPHNDVLQWMAETGVVGFVAALLAVACLIFAVPTMRGRSHRRPIAVGLAGFAAYSMVDFPTAIPALALAATALVVLVTRTTRDAPRARPALVRAALVLLATLQLPAAMVHARRAAEQDAIQQLRADPADLRAQSVLAERDPNHQALLLAALRTAPAGPSGLAVALDAANRAPHDPVVLLQAGARLSSVAYELAIDLLMEARRHAPWDWRVRATIARAHALAGQEDAAAAAWLQALEREAPPSVIAEAFRARPDTAWWSTHLAGLGPRYHLALVEASPETTRGIAWRAAHDGPVPPDTRWFPGPRMRALVASGRHDDARALLEDVLRARVPIWGVPDTLTEVVDAAPDPDMLLDQLAGAVHDQPWLRVPTLELTKRRDGSEAALALLRRWQLAGMSDPSLRPHEAQLLAETGDIRGCVRVLRADADHDATLAEATARCSRQALDAPTTP